MSLGVFHLGTIAQAVPGLSTFQVPFIHLGIKCHNLPLSIFCMHVYIVVYGYIPFSWQMAGKNMARC